jgi:hypothetical protein
MPIKRYKAEQIVSLLRQIEVEIANGKTTPQACKETQITVQTYSLPSRISFGPLLAPHQCRGTDTRLPHQLGQTIWLVALLSDSAFQL